MPAFLNKMRALFHTGQFMTNVELDNNLKSILSRVREVEPAVYPCFSAMYYTGCRATESISPELWTVNSDNSYTLAPLKNNLPRHFDNFEIPFEFQLYIESINQPPYVINYERLRYLFKSFSLYPRIWIGNKESTLHLFRHNFVKKLMSQGFSNVEIQTKLGERNLKSAMSYVDSQYRI